MSSIPYEEATCLQRLRIRRLLKPAWKSSAYVLNPHFYNEVCLKRHQNRSKTVSTTVFLNHLGERKYLVWVKLTNTRRCLALCVLKIFFTLLWISSPFAGGGHPELNLQEEEEKQTKRRNISLLKSSNLLFTDFFFFFLNYEACITSVYLEHIQCLDLILFLLWGTRKETFRSTA